MFDIAKFVSDTKVPDNFITDIRTKAFRQVKKFSIKKKNGGDRTILQPSRKLKLFQYWVIQCFAQKMKTHTAAAAYTPGASIKQNAERHKHHAYHVKIDLTDFFSSITPSDFLTRLYLLPEYSKELDDLITKCCFYNGKLPIGYPSSPFISNIVMYEFDECMTTILKAEISEDITYSRYADDLIISTNKPHTGKQIIDKTTEIINASKSPKITINPSKTRAMSSMSGSSFITGLRITKDNRTIVHRKVKQHVTLLLKHFRKGTLKVDDIPSLKGHIAHLKHVDPEFYTKININYFTEIRRLHLVS